MKEELIQFIEKAVREKHVTDQSPLNGATLAELIRANFPGDAIQEAGYEKLSHAVRDASERGLVHRNQNVKHLEVLPADVDFKRLTTGTLTSKQYVRSDAWRAFAMQFSNQLVYFNRPSQTFEVHSTPSSRDDLIAVKPPSNDDFREWINDFGAASSATVPSEILESSASLKDFSRWIATQDAPLAIKWKKFRTAKVVDAIKKWGILAGVETSDFLTQVQPRSSCVAVTADMQSPDQCDSVMNAVIACIQDMSRDEIESLSIPLRHVLRHFRPRS